MMGSMGASIEDFFRPKELSMNELLASLAPDEDYGTSASSRAMDSEPDEENPMTGLGAVQAQAQLSSLNGPSSPKVNQGKDAIMGVLAQRAQERRAASEQFQASARKTNLTAGK